ncbi:hypothetical protein ACFVHB_30265 [Kitasatospora sp. NPDC127111]
MILTDGLPVNRRFVSAVTDKGGCVTPPAGSADTVTCGIGALAAGA